MFALIFSQLLDLGRMTGKTGFRQCGREGDRQGGVRVRVACQATLGLKVRLALMTLAARGDIVLRGRTVTGVAILARNGLVARTLSVYFGGLSCMALDAITGVERRLFTLPRQSIPRLNKKIRAHRQ
jgi:hypothetical protein